MLPYQAVAMDYAGYQRQSTQGHHGTHMASMSSLGLSGVGATSFTHSWLVPSQDLCAVSYNKMANQHQPGAGIHSQQPSIEPGILELRKEKSRDAARSRRGKENYEFYELAKMLPLPAAITSQLDKASIIRLTISYLKLRDFSGHGDPPWTREASASSKLKSASIRRSPAVDLFEQHQGTHILQSLDGFALAVAADGRFLYISETVSIYLGLSQVEMTGSSIFDYIHQGDHNEIAEQLGLSLASNGVNGGVGVSSGSNSAGLASPTSGASDDGAGPHSTNNPDVSGQMTVSSTSGYKGYERSFCVRMKSTLTKRGCHFKSSGYRANDITVNGGKNGKTTGTNYSVVLLLCKLRPQYTFSHSRKSQPPLLGMVALAIALPPPSVHEIRLECDMFVTRINFDFRIAHCEPRVSDLLDYGPEDLVGKSLYSLCHAEDANRLRKSHLDLVEKGQVLTGYFRLMNKNGGYTWMQSCATVVCSTKNADEQNIICVNYVISSRENENLILDCCQLEQNANNIKHEEANNDKSSDSLRDISTSDRHLDTNSEGKSTVKVDNKDSHIQRTRCRSVNSSTSLSLNNLISTDDNSTSTGINIDVTGNMLTSTAITSVTVATPTVSIGTTKRKRKSKVALQSDDNDDTNRHNTLNTVNEVQPIAKIPALEKDDQRNDLLTVVDEQQRKTSSIQQSNEASVKEIENAMSKHLPSPGNASSGPPTTDFSTDALLKQQQQNEKSSTIQWIGAPHYQQPAPMPATALLRQLYANRESVIRATARQTSTGGFYSDQQAGPLPTPPGSESSYDNQYLQLHSHTQKTSTDAFTNLVSTYGGYHSTIDYHNAMTPPSSVSPRDSTNVLNAAKTPSHTNNNYDYAEPLRAPYTAPTTSDSNGTSALPLKPQPYSVATAAMHHPHTTPDTSITYSNLDQPQYFASHSSFHLYHKSAPTSGWYSTPS